MDIFDPFCLRTGWGSPWLNILPKGPFLSFSPFAFHSRITAGISSAGYSTPTPIQSRTIPAILAGRDVLGLAQTGTGKTAAFVLPILQHLMLQPRRVLRVLIVSPTRELAEQTHTAISDLGRQTGLRSITVYGGVSAQPQIKGLQAGVEIVVACPGRLLDLMGQKALSLKNVEILVLDEADQMFDMGFLPAIRRILAALPKKRQTLLFSATMPPEIRSWRMSSSTIRSRSNWGLHARSRQSAMQPFLLSRPGKSRHCRLSCEAQAMVRSWSSRAPSTAPRSWLSN